MNELRVLLSAVLFTGLALQSPPVLAQRAEAPGRPVLAAPGHRDTADDLRGDIDNQSRLTDADREIEKVWKLVEEARQRAQNIHLMYARIKDLSENRDCVIGERLLDTIRRSRDGLARLRANLESQCQGVNGAAQRQLAEACESEARSISVEYQASQRQEEDVYSSCPSLKGANLDQKR